MTGERFTLRVNPEIAEYLHGEENRIVVSLEQIIGKPIVIYPHKEFHMEEFDIFESRAWPAIIRTWHNISSMYMVIDYGGFNCKLIEARNAKKLEGNR